MHFAPIFPENGRKRGAKLFCAHFPGKWAHNAFCARAQGAGRRALFTQGPFYLDLCWIRLARNMKFCAREIHVTHCVALSSSPAPHFKDEIASLRKRPFFAGF